MNPVERRRLAASPLHEITARSGEAGLRARFAIEVAGCAQPDRLRLGRALELASRLHAADRRQSEPYVSHLLRVAIRISSHYQVREGDVLCAALLHDAVEDHAAQLAADGRQASALAELGAQFGGQVAELVGAVTNPGYQPGPGAAAQYRDHVAASLERCPQARVIKVSDFIDNGGGLIHAAGPAVARLARKYAPLVPVLAGLIARPDTPLRPEVKTRILRQLDRARDDMDQLLA
jgi:(p)ppGpp synthase/HD superfamily hydrolase